MEVPVDSEIRTQVKKSGVALNKACADRFEVTANVRVYYIRGKNMLDVLLRYSLGMADSARRRGSELAGEMYSCHERAEAVPVLIPLGIEIASAHPWEQRKEVGLVFEFELMQRVAVFICNRRDDGDVEPATVEDELVFVRHRFGRPPSRSVKLYYERLTVVAPDTVDAIYIARVGRYCSVQCEVKGLFYRVEYEVRGKRIEVHSDRIMDREASFCLPKNCSCGSLYLRSAPWYARAHNVALE